MSRLNGLLYRRVAKGVRSAKADSFALDDLRFLVDPEGFRPTCIAPQDSVRPPPRRLKRLKGASKDIDGITSRLPLPDSVVASAYNHALKASALEFSTPGNPDAARAFWAIKRLESIASGDVRSAGGLLHDDLADVAPIRSEGYPYWQRFIPNGAASSPGSDREELSTEETEALCAKGAEDPGAVVFARSRCANTECGPVRFHLRLSVFNNDAVYPMHIVNTHLFAVTDKEPHTLTELSGLMPLVNTAIPPAIPSAVNDAGSSAPPSSTGKGSAKDEESFGDALASPAMPSCEFDVVLPVEANGYVRGTIYYCHMPTAPAEKGFSVASSNSAPLVAVRHPLATEYGTLRAIRFGPVKLDKAVWNYPRLTSSQNH